MSARVFIQLRSSYSGGNAGAARGRGRLVFAGRDSSLTSRSPRKSLEDVNSGIIEELRRRADYYVLRRFSSRAGL